jgi:hypothetical protein
MILSGSTVQVKGFGSSLVSRTKRLMAVWRSTIDRNTPRLRRLLSFAKKPSTSLSQEHEVAYSGTRSGDGDLATPAYWVLVRPIVIEDHADDLANWNLGFDRVQETDELLMPMALHAAPDGFACEHVECGE